MPGRCLLEFNTGTLKFVSSLKFVIVRFDLKYILNLFII